MRKIFLLILSIISVVTSVTFSFAFAETGLDPQATDPQVTEQQELQVKTISELGNATIAGSAVYDDGMLLYSGSGDTVGYKGDYSNTLVEFDLVFDFLQFPAWFSLTFKASGFDRTQSSNLAQKGYSILIYYNGNVEVRKPGLTTITGKINNMAEGVKYRVRVGAYNENEAVRIYLSVDGVEIINALDQVDPYLTGAYFNICGDGGTKARLYSTKKEVVPDYFTYTNSTMGSYPTATASGVSYDKYKNVSLHSSAGTFGWWQGLRDFSFETKINWEKFGNGANLWVAMRAERFDRVTTAHNGYCVRVGRAGVVDIYKNGTKITGGKWKYEQNTDFIFEFGVVDLDENRTMVFVNVNGAPAVTMVDDNEPLRRHGWLNFNGDGEINCTFKSVSTKVTPLVTKVIDNISFYTIETYFNNTVSYTDMEMEDFSSILLDAIWLNNCSVAEWNDGFYALSNSERQNAVSLQYQNNKLIITINKTLYNKANNNQTEFIFNELMLKKTGVNKGFVCPTGYQLKQTYYYNI